MITFMIGFWVGRWIVSHLPLILFVGFLIWIAENFF